MIIENMGQLKRSDRSRIRKIDNTYYLVAGKDCYQINEIGALIINAVGKDITIEAVSKKLSVMYNNPSIENIYSDVQEFINFIIEKKIVEGPACEEMMNT